MCQGIPFAVPSLARCRSFFVVLPARTFLRASPLLRGHFVILPTKGVQIVSKTKKRFVLSIFAVLLIVVISFLAIVLPERNQPVEQNPASYYNEPYRPQYHFTPEANWMNDPNGMVYYEGEYHLFYQYHPFGTRWGPMHWGHAVSKDLVHWEHLPIALKPDEHGYIFSGSAVVDWNNTSGFGTDPKHPPLVALFTHAKDKQVQSLAYSTDKGRTWKMYEGNPVMPDPPVADWRDPKVFWHEETRQWVMILAAGEKAMIYTSPDLKAWTYASEFGKPNGAPDGIWECPDLFPLPVDGNPGNKKWVLIVSINDGAPAGGSGMQYFVGDFDGKTFTNGNPADTTLWADYGADFYAGVTWSDDPKGKESRLWLAWMSNWQYANDTPTSTWRGAFSLVRKLELKTLPEGIRMIQTPADGFEQLRHPVKSLSAQTVQPGDRTLSAVHGDTLEIVAEFRVDPNTTADEFGIQVRTGERNRTTIGYNRDNASLFVDRSQSGITDFNGGFAKRHEAPLEVRNNKVKMHIFVDRSSVEVFGNNGETVITDQIFPDPSDTGLELYAAGGNVTLESLHIYALDKVWTKNPFHGNLTNWQTVNGSWTDTRDGKQGRGEKASYAMTAKTEKDFVYEADIKLSESAIGTGGLAFRSNKDGSKGYVASLDAVSDVVRLYNSSNNETIAAYRTPIEPGKTYRMKVAASGSDITVYLGDKPVITASDKAYKKGRFGLFVQNDTFFFQNVTVSEKSLEWPLPLQPDSGYSGEAILRDLTNPGFETGDLTGWKVVSGNIYADGDVAADKDFWGGGFGFEGGRHLWGHKAGKDDRTGVLKSENFILSGNGTVNFLIGGGHQADKLYVALVRASDGAELFKETGPGTESYRRVTWDASQYLGQELYIKVMDNSMDGFGHLNVDDFHVKN
jgi:fructan beta-fructosidase